MCIANPRLSLAQWTCAQVQILREFMERIKSGQFTVIKLQAGLNFFSPPIKLKKLATRYTKQAFSSGLQIESFLKNFTFLFFKKKNIFIYSFGCTGS